MFKHRIDNLRMVSFFIGFFGTTIILMYGLISYIEWDFNMWNWSHECQRISGLLATIVALLGYGYAKDNTFKEALKEVMKLVEERKTKIPFEIHAFEYVKMRDEIISDEFEKRFGKIK